jgi:site-specific DNA-methyltransferase (adenine-specific)/modification methylase
MNWDIKLGDCKEIMSTIPDNSVDMILTDLPYDVLNKNNPSVQWDKIIPIDKLWEHWLRICKENAPIVLFGQGMFTSLLMMSQPKLWRYNLIWNKRRSTGFLNAKKMPLRSHEDILVFYRKQPTYNPQMTKALPGEETHSRGKVKDFTNRCYGKFNFAENKDLTMKFPKSIIDIPKEAPTKLVHPTQKPVKLCAWLIKTFTNEGDTVLDNCMGIGSTGIACVQTNRNFIGVELCPEYFDKAKELLQKEQSKCKQMEINYQ